MKHSKSDAQANAEALARRGEPYTEAHRNSWVFTRTRTDPPTELFHVIAQLRKAYADEVPPRIHKHETSEGGTPEWSPEFARYLTGSDVATDKDDTFPTPFRAALAGMVGSDNDIVVMVVMGDAGPVEAVQAVAGIEDARYARIVADHVLRHFWKRMSNVRLDLRSERVA